MQLVLWMLRLYPQGWRERYQEEMVALLEQHTLTPWTIIDLLFGALDARLDPSYRRAHPLVEQQTSRRLSIWRLGYWLTTGVLISGVFAGCALVGLFNNDNLASVVWFLLLLIVYLLLFVGLWRLRSREWWALLIGLGGLLAPGYLFSMITAGPACPPSNTLTLPYGGATSVSCTVYPSPFVNALTLAFFFAPVALGIGGLVLSSLVLRRKRG